MSLSSSYRQHCYIWALTNFSTGHNSPSSFLEYHHKQCHYPYLKSTIPSPVISFQTYIPNLQRCNAAHPILPSKFIYSLIRPCNIIVRFTHRKAGVVVGKRRILTFHNLIEIHQRRHPRRVPGVRVCVHGEPGHKSVRIHRRPMSKVNKPVNQHRGKVIAHWAIHGRIQRGGSRVLHSRQSVILLRHILR